MLQNFIGCVHGNILHRICLVVFAQVGNDEPFLVKFLYIANPCTPSLSF